MVTPFNPLTVPAVLQQSVRRINEGGFPAQALLDYEQALQSWMQQNTINLNQQVADVNSRVDTVSDEVDGVSAAVTVETTARVNGDNALALQATSLSAAFDGFSANGDIYFTARAGPAGSVAAYGLYLSAGDAWGGFEIIAVSGGGAAIGLTANQLYFTDSGTGENVFNWNSSDDVFEFNTNVRINGELIQPGTVNQITPFSGTPGDFVFGLEPMPIPYTDMVGMATTFVIADPFNVVDIAAELGFTISATGSPVTCMFRVILDGVEFFEMPAAFLAAGSEDFVRRQVAKTYLAAGSHTAKIQFTADAGGSSIFLNYGRLIFHRFKG